MKSSEPKQWYSKLKRTSSVDQSKQDEVLVESISTKSDQEQAELIADEFAKVSNEYSP